MNFFIENTAVLSLENNLPAQFFDLENEADSLPVGSLPQMEGIKRISFDRQRYLDLTHPGRVQHFTSFTDLLYWERFQQLKSQHEIARGKISSFSPLARFPNTISVFHCLATKPQVLSVVREAIEDSLAKE